ncbi:MAG: hypothetical protein ACREEE_05725 [Dongiaceae bacterium]
MTDRHSRIVHVGRPKGQADGRIVERGRHPDLLAQGGKYAAMWRRQQEAAGEVERQTYTA